MLDMIIEDMSLIIRTEIPSTPQDFDFMPCLFSRQSRIRDETEARQRKISSSSRLVKLYLYDISITHFKKIERRQLGVSR